MENGNTATILFQQCCVNDPAGQGRAVYRQTHQPCSQLYMQARVMHAGRCRPSKEARCANEDVIIPCDQLHRK